MFSLISLELNDTTEGVLRFQLKALYERMPALFKNTPVVLNLNHLSKGSRTQFSMVKQLFLTFNIHVIAVRGGTASQQKDAIKAGLPVFHDNTKLTKNDVETKNWTEIFLPTKKSINLYSEEHVTGSIKKNSLLPCHEEKKTPVLYVNHPVRSGQQVYHTGDIVITSPVNTGAEILAGGNIHVYSALRGRALAGIDGDLSARIFCCRFEAELLSIGGHFKPITSKINKYWKKAVQIYLKDQLFQFEQLI